MSNVMAIPPKMAQQFSERAKRGDADEVHGSTYIFYNGPREMVVLLSLDPPCGYVEKIKARPQ